MPSGKTHARVTSALAGISLATCLYFDLSQLHTVGILTGLLVTPDCDLNSGTPGGHIIRKIPFIGKRMAILWEIYWKPYSIIAMHRQIISHSLIIGTAIRAFYLLWWLNLIPKSVFYWSWFVGLCVADTFHIIFDMVDEFIEGMKIIIRSVRGRKK